MNVCGLTRILVPAALTGMAVATVFGSDAWGVLAAVALGAVLWSVERLRGGSASCGVSLPVTAGESAEPLPRAEGHVKTVSRKPSSPA